MDPLSVTASVIAVLQLTSTVITYLSDVKDAPRECQQCAIEASNLLNLLISLRYRLEQAQSGDCWFTAVKALGVQNGPLDQYKQALEQLQSKVQVENGPQKLKRRLLWNFSKAEVAGILGRMERLKSLTHIALEMDHFELSQAIKADLNALYTTNEAIKDSTASMRDTLPILHTDVVAIRNTQGMQQDSLRLQQHQAIMQWLSLTDFSAQQHDIISRRQEGTAQWFLDSPEFKKWLEGSVDTLFCPGIPGAGKTMIAAIAIDHLYGPAYRDNIGVAYLFCSYKSQIDQSASSLLATLLKQLVQNRPDIAAPVTHIYDKHSKQKSKPSFEDIFLALQSVCSSYITVYVVADALDECADRDGTRTRLIDILLELQTGMDVRLLFTSRFLPEITQRFQSNLKLEVRANEEDVRRFVAGRMPHLPNCIRRDEELKHAVQNKIVEAVDGMFLLARLHVDSLLDKRNKQRVLSTLNKLSKGSAALDEAYSEALRRIDGQLAEDRLLARHTISWIIYAKRPLTKEELCLVLAIESGDKSLNDDNIYDIEDAISVCAGLITVDEESGIVRPVHYTTHEYFERVSPDWNPGAREDIAVACLTYLSFDTFRSGSCDSDATFEQRLTKNGFFDYSARYWSEHIQLVELSTSTSNLAMAFLCNAALVDSAIQVAFTRSYGYSDYSNHFPNRTEGLHFTARYGLFYLTEMLLRRNSHGDNMAQIKSKDSYGETPLSLAAKNGHKAVFKLLSENGRVDVNSKYDERGRTPLSLAAIIGHEAVVKLLLEGGEVDVNSKDDERGRTALSLAAIYGHEKVAKLLLESSKIDVNSKDDQCGQTALSLATLFKSKVIVKLLLESDKVDVNLKELRYGRTPLSIAAREGQEAIVKLLLESDKVNVNLRDNERGRTALSLAAIYGHEAVVKLLLKSDRVDVNSKDDEYGGTALSLAAKHGHEMVVKLLLESNKVDMNLKDDEYGGMPLLLAMRHGKEAVVKLLLGSDRVDVNLKDHKCGQKGLWLAALFGHEAIVRLFLESGRADVESSDDERIQTALRLAAQDGTEAVIKLLLESGRVKVNSKYDEYGRTPLSLAAIIGHEAVVKLLLEDGEVDVNLKDDGRGRTALSLAAMYGHEAVVKLLLESGRVDIDSKDKKYGRTPLLLAARYGSEAVVKLLLESDKVDVNLKELKYGRTALLTAARYGKEAVVKVLLESDRVNVNLKDNERGWTALSLATIYNHNKVVKLLLESDRVDVNLRDGERGRTALSLATIYGHNKIVKLLLESDRVNVNLRDNERGRTALSLAAIYEQEVVVKLLLESDRVDANLRDNEHGRTALSLAAIHGHNRVVKLLLKSDRVDVNLRDNERGRTALSLAAIYEQEAVVKLLLESDKVDVNSKDDEYGGTALSLATKYGGGKVVKLLLESGKVNVNSTDS